MPDTSKPVETDLVKEKLVELLSIGHECPDERNPFLEESCSTCPYGKAKNCGAEMQADHLIANGVTVQECKVGDSIYEADGEHGVVKHDVYEICVIYKTTATDGKGNKWDDYWTSDDIGNAFKTRIEAEAALQQPPKGD